MAGRRLPAICGPAGQERGKDSADGTVVVVEEQVFVEGDGLPTGDLVSPEGDLERRHPRHGGLARYLGRVFGNEATVGRDSGGHVRGNAVDKRRIRVGSRVAVAAEGSEIGGRTGRIGHGTRPVQWRQATAVSKKGLAFDRCLSFGRR